jgi:uncharacterized protein (DUF1810 family)
MWFVFPQLAGLGRSEMAQRFALGSLAEAARYAGHPMLGHRLRECTRLVVRVHDRTAAEIFDFPDDLKFHSCLTLFTLAVRKEPLFQAALDKYFDGRRDDKTVTLLGGA